MFNFLCGLGDLRGYPDSSHALEVAGRSPDMFKRMLVATVVVLVGYTGWNIYDHAELAPYDALDRVLASVKR